jgi:hypothetical protein
MKGGGGDEAQDEPDGLIFVNAVPPLIDSQNAGRAACVTDLDDRVTRV